MCTQPLGRACLLSRSPFPNTPEGLMPTFFTGRRHVQQHLPTSTSFLTYRRSQPTIQPCYSCLQDDPYPTATNVHFTGSLRTVDINTVDRNYTLNLLCVVLSCSLALTTTDLVVSSRFVLKSPTTGIVWVSGTIHDFFLISHWSLYLSPVLISAFESVYQMTAMVRF